MGRRTEVMLGPTRASLGDGTRADRSGSASSESRGSRPGLGLRRTERVSRKLTVFLVIAMGWATLVGLGLFLADVRLGSGLGIVVTAVLYMPAPLVAALIAEGGIRRCRFRLPR